VAERKLLDISAYQRESRSRPCFICRIVDGTHPVHHEVVYRDDAAIAFLNRYPSLYGYVLVCPVEHRTGVVRDFELDEYLRLQAVVHRVGRAVSSAVPTERLYVLSLGSDQGNAHVHWHVAPLPAGVAYEQQQFASLVQETCGGYLDLSADEADDLAGRIRAELAADGG
jgi:diadenosine tetraphosphate (Ap4A) HIT family hydrolase